MKTQDIDIQKIKKAINLNEDDAINFINQANKYINALIEQRLVWIARQRANRQPASGKGKDLVTTKNRKNILTLIGWL